MKTKKKLLSVLLVFAIVLAAVQIPGIVRANQAKNLVDVLAENKKNVIVLGTEGAYVEAGTTVEIPSGKTLIIPYKSGITRENQANGDSADTPMEASAYSTLELQEGAKLVINGSVVVGALTGPAGNCQNAITGGYGQIITGDGSVIEVNKTFKNYGIVSGSGELIANAGSTVSDLFTIFNYRGTNYLYNAATSANLFPMNEFGSDNIKIKSTYYKGATLNGLAKALVNIPKDYQMFLGDSMYFPIEFAYIGDTGVYKSQDGGMIVKEIIADSGSETKMSQERITFVGGGILDKTNLKVVVIKGILQADMKSSNFLFPINGYTTMVVESGTMEVTSGFKFLPGSSLTIKEDATLLLDETKDITLGKYSYEEPSACVESSAFLLFYEGGEGEGTFGAAEKNIGGTKYAGGTDSANLIVEGKLQIRNKGFVTGNIIADNGEVLLPCTWTDEQLSTPVVFESNEASTASSSPAVAKVKTSVTWSNVANIDADTHEVANWDTTDATCTADGQMSGLCDVCGEVITKQIVSEGHKEEVIASVAPTCTETGLTEGSKCSVCGLVLVEQEVIEALGHDWEEAVNVPPTCTEPGYASAARCKTCGLVDGDEENISTPALGHKPVEVEAKEPECTAPGNTAGSRCETCGEVLEGIEEIPALSEDLQHKPEIVPGKAPTCLEGGFAQSEKCFVCGKVLSGGEELPALNENFQHTPVDTPAKAPTCTSKGHSKGSKCSVCGEILKAQQELPALDHSYEWKVVKEPTQYLQGLESGTCSACGESEFRILEKLTEAPSTGSGTTKPGTSGGNNSSSGGSNSGSNNNSSSSSSSNSSSSSKDAADTGDNANVVLLFGMMIVSFGAIVFVSRKRREN